MLKIYNSLTRKKEIFVSIEERKVKMYVCGMTVYDYCHLGHGRVMVVFDMIRRWLEVLGYTVTYVQNVTDIDDKIIKRAKDDGLTCAELAEKFIKEMRLDITRLGVRPPDHEPRATDCVEDMLRLIKILVEKDIAYPSSDGDVYFSVSKFKRYGELSGKTLSELWAGQRVAVNDKKHDPLDFVLWKKSKLGEPTWESPWGPGRPGWHIECSAMSKKYLGEHFDIHGGGEDLQFPHHENEVAQSESANNSKFVNYWIHNGFVRVGDEKMSKSLNNFFTIRELMKTYDPEVLRFFILRAHYRSPLNYSEGHIEDARQSLGRLYSAVKLSSLRSTEVDWNCPYAKRFRSAMSDDFNTPDAIASLFALTAEVNKSKSKSMADQLKALAITLGLLTRSSQDFFQSTEMSREISADIINTKITERNNARKAKDFKRADKIRDDLWEKGVELEDAAEETKWRYL